MLNEGPNGGTLLKLIEDNATNTFRLDHPHIVLCRSMQDIEKVLLTGEKTKTVHATQMNERSSRSHCLFTITLTQMNKGTCV